MRSSSPSSDVGPGRSRPTRRNRSPQRFGNTWLAISASLAPRAWAAVLGLAFFSTMIAFILFLRGLAVLRPVRTAIVSTVEPFWTAIVGALALAQPMSPRTAAGGVLIAAAVVLLQVAHAREEPRHGSV